MSAERLYRLRDEGAIEAIGRGLYRRADTARDSEDPDLIEISYRAPKATLCLTTALAHHGLTDVIPATIDIAIPRGTRPPKLLAPTTIHSFAAKTFGIGRERLPFDSGILHIYSAERSIIDMIRLRHLEGSEIGWEALRRWLRQRGSTPAKLLQLARSFHGAEPALRSALEVVL